VTGHEYGDAVVVITAPVVRLLNGIATGKHGTRSPGLVEKLPADARRITDFCLGSSVGGKAKPPVQSHEAVAARIARMVMRACDVPIN
jgi:hypothetical protein